MQRYNPRDIEAKWQKTWDETGIYKADLNSSKPKYIAMSMFNYPSGAGIHIGHAMNYTISDVKARFKRQQGYESYHPIGWDAFGLPAENYAIKAGVSPQASMAKIIPDYHTQYKAMGWSNDWSREIATHEPGYYKWTQWIFSQMFKAGLAYQEARMQWWCTKCQTVLANEQVINGKCWRHDGADDLMVEKKEVKQWFFKITEYADELLEAVEDLDWTESVKLAQKNWIGRSRGAEIKFKVEAEKDQVVDVFTTRPDTLFGATFLVLAPEHELVSSITTPEQKAEIEAYIKTAVAKSEVERQASKDKSGVFTGAYAINPINQAKLPIWIADYVLTGYGTGAIMAVPAHDERDNDFAQKHNLPIVEAVSPYLTNTGINAARDDVETLERRVVDMFIINSDGKYLLQAEEDNTHFVGGGVDPEDENDEAAVRREILEEVGFTHIAEIKPATSTITTYAYRIPKQKNQLCNGIFYEVRLGSNAQVPSEIEDGRHSIKWVDKEDVAALITWEGHAYAWQQYLAGGQCFAGEGIMINSGKFSSQKSSDAREQIVAELENQGLAEAKTNYKMRDWSVSRQRYWGAPIPIINCPKDGAVLVPDQDLPVVLPVLEDFQPSGDGRSALARATDWLKVTCPSCGGQAERETDTLDTYICSSWYMYRYFDPKNDQAIFDTATVDKWAPIDFYNGGDHATAHLLYARFVARFFHKLGLTKHAEPFKQMLFNGKVTASDGSAFSKSKGNGIDPLEIINSGYGADALRTYLMFAAPLEFTAKWDPQGVPGTYRFLTRLWNVVQEYSEAPEGETPAEQTKVMLRVSHSMVKKMTEDIQENRYNTAIATAMGALNELYKQKGQSLNKNETWNAVLSNIVACVAPFAPHIASELWQQMGNEGSAQVDSWPQWDDALMATDTITVVVQVNGKVRGQLQLAAGVSQDEAVAAAQTDEKVAGYLAGQEIRKTIFVPGKLVNFVL